MNIGHQQPPTRKNRRGSVDQRTRRRKKKRRKEKQRKEKKKREKETPDQRSLD